jgi:hypothetical protein
MWLVILIQTTATSGGSATLVMNFVTDDNAALSSPTILLSSSSFAVATLTAGKVVLMVALPLDAAVLWERFVGLQQVTGVAAFTAGKIDAFLTHDIAKWKAYADASN